VKLVYADHTASKYAGTSHIFIGFNTPAENENSVTMPVTRHHQHSVHTARNVRVIRPLRHSIVAWVTSRSVKLADGPRKHREERFGRPSN
jgi:hypothetical protein